EDPANVIFYGAKSCLSTDKPVCQQTSLFVNRQACLSTDKPVCQQTSLSALPAGEFMNPPNCLHV
ncbi:MAG: hypothetical protein ACK58Q_07725, partial [Chitinophagales bacterium]